jgi:endoglucanase Acf2
MAFSPISTTSPNTLGFSNKANVGSPASSNWGFGIPRKTNTFWINLVVNPSWTGGSYTDGLDPVGTFPYIFKNKPQGIEYGYQPNVNSFFRGTNISYTDSFSVGSTANFTLRKVVSQNPFGAEQLYTTATGGQEMRTWYIEGMAFSTIKFANLTPTITASGALLRINNVQGGSITSTTFTGQSFELEFNNGLVWLLYAPVSISFTVSSSPAWKITFTTTYTNIIKFAFLGKTDEIPATSGRPNAFNTRRTVLDVYGVNPSYVTGGTIDNTTFSGNTATYTITWSKVGTSPLLHFCLPHHETVLVSPNYKNLTMRSMRGVQKVIEGDQWVMTENLTTVGINYTPFLSSDIPAIQSALNTDYRHSPASDIDTYFGFKEIQKVAQMALIANQIGDTAKKNYCLNTLKQKIEPWLYGVNQSYSTIDTGVGYTGTDGSYIANGQTFVIANNCTTTTLTGTGTGLKVNVNINQTAGGQIWEYFTNVAGTGYNDGDTVQVNAPSGFNNKMRISKNPMRYDTEYGGFTSDIAMNTRDGLFGSGGYNDHHFHYGYFIQPCAVIAYLDPTWATPAIKERVDLFVRDIMNPSTSDTFFPQFRGKDLYLGHAFAGGLGPSGDVNNQESTSEDINAWYACYNWFTYTSRTQLADLSRLFLTLSQRAAQKYWHIYDNSIYSGIFASTLMVGIVWVTKCDYATFFSGNDECIHGIQFIPWTPISTSTFPNQTWNQNEWNFLNTNVFERSYPVGTSISNQGSGYSGTNGGYTANGDTFTVANNVQVTGGSGSSLLLNMNINMTKGGKIWEVYVVGESKGSGYHHNDIVNIVSNTGGLVGGTNGKVQLLLEAEQGWLGLLYKFRVFTDPNDAWNRTNTISNFDNGESKTSSLAYISQFRYQSVTLDSPIATVMQGVKTIINWQPITGATQYELQVTTTSDISFTAPVYSNSSITSFITYITGLSASTPYIYRLRAKNNTPVYSSYFVGNFTTLPV